MEKCVIAKIKYFDMRQKLIRQIVSRLNYPIISSNLFVGTSILIMDLNTAVNSLFYSNNIPRAGSIYLLLHLKRI